MIKTLRLQSKHLLLLFVGAILCFHLHAQIPAAPKNTGSNISSQQAQEALDFHNNARRSVGVTQLEWSTDLSGFAQKWAENLAATGCETRHRPATGEWQQHYGENIFLGFGVSYTPLDASETWYDEIKAYKFATVTEKNYAKGGHYTQMIWKTTTRLGMGLATCANGSIIIVANYDPPGNYLGEKPY